MLYILPEAADRDIASLTKCWKTELGAESVLYPHYI